MTNSDEHSMNRQENQSWFGNLSRPAVFQAGKYSLPLGKRTLIMGILNITPDSFYPGSRTDKVDLAYKKVEEMTRQGADIIDIGGESTRPGGEPLSLEEEMARVIPVIESISGRIKCPLSIDTYKPEVADAALKAGACIVNDIMGLQGDPAMPGIVSSHNAGIIIMHNARLYRDEAAAEKLSQTELASGNIIRSMINFLERSLIIAQQAGLTKDQIVIDPGIGFGVTAEESIQMLVELSELLTFDLPILIGPSRKRFIGHILDKPVEQRLHGTSSAVALGIARGADIVRVHDVAEQADVVRVADALCRSRIRGVL